MPKSLDQHTAREMQARQSEQLTPRRGPYTTNRSLYINPRFAATWEVRVGGGVVFAWNTLGMASVAMHARRLWTYIQTLPAGTQVMMVSVVISTICLDFAWSVAHVPRTEELWHLLWVPRHSWKRPWTVLTSLPCTISVMEMALHLCILPILAPALEQQWGMLELIRFSSVVGVVSRIVLFVLAYVLAGIQEVLTHKQYVLNVCYNGLYAVFIGFLVAYTQLWPDHVLAWPESYRYRDALMLVVGVSNIPILFGLYAPFLEMQVAWIVAWIYLRFYQPHGTGLWGDASSSFAFAKFFPTVIQPFLAPISRRVYHAASTLRVLPVAMDDDMDLELHVSGLAPTNPRAEAERHRTMALSALDPAAPELAAGAAPPAPAPSPQSTT